ncbi:ABC transporter substrate-binding protein [Aquabacterium sp. A7-Y]|uniref:ABC transporter substrate-binding protein n=1 Tax=Aquabacterium sp. A7-Y TaxID=1349605 RepID=UPI00223D9168|nr:ABC transporter substrate-binding protein [Aquabacterium sp. A7-Y]MCW7539358.1 ABC transporter substrate-binding protein [Aquabacterium sp. A7-Y]
MQRQIAARLFVLLFGGLLASFAAKGQTPAPIVIGQTTALTGGPAASVREMTLVAKLYFDAVNAKGGIKGRPIQLVTLDDAYDPARSAANTIKLIEEHQAIGMFLSRGTATTAAMLPVLTKYKIPLIGPSTGAMSLHHPLQPYVFNVRASYQSEAAKAVEQVVGMGLKRFGLVYVDDAFGVDALAGVSAGLAKTGVQPAYIEKFDRKATDFSRIIDVAVKADAQALLIIATNEPTIALIRGFRKAGGRGYVITLSNNASGGFVAQLGPLAAGVIVAQVFPPERRMDIPLVAETAQLLSRSNSLKEVKVSPAMLEGLAAAKVLVAALRAAPAPTPQDLVAALQSGKRFDVGWPGYEVKYSATDHTGLEWTDLSIVSASGQFRR